MYKDLSKPIKDMPFDVRCRFYIFKKSDDKIDRMYGFSLIMTQYRQANWDLISNNKFIILVWLLVLVILARGDFNGIRDYKKVLLDNWLMFLLLLLLDWFIVFSILNMVTEVLILAIDTCIYFLYKWSNDNI